MYKTKIVSIPKENVNYLIKYIDKINKKALSIGCDKIDITNVSEIYRKYSEDFMSAIDYIDVTIDYDIVKISGYSLLAQIEHGYDSGNIVNTFSDDIKTEENWYHTDANCEHCNINRYRRYTYIIKKDDGSIKQVGKTCLKDYTGYDIIPMLNMLEMVENIEEYMENISLNNGGGTQRDIFNTKMLLNITKMVCDRYGYLSKSNAEYNQIPTSYRVLDIISNGKNMSDTQKYIYRTCSDMRSENKLYEEVENAIAWINSENSDNSYINNLKILVNEDYIDIKHIGYISSLLKAYENHMEKIRKAEEKIKDISNEYIGDIGSKMELYVKFIKSSSFDTIYGRSNIYIFQDNIGNELKWFTSTSFNIPDEEYFNIKFTVKNHDEYNGRKQTTITRVKLA